LDLALVFAVLVIGSVVASLLYEGIAGNTHFSLPFGNMGLVTLVGIGLYFVWGWPASLTVLGLYVVFCLIGGLMDRNT
jgi:hypothetical protein